MFGTPAQHCIAHIIDATDKTEKDMWLPELREITGQDSGQDIGKWKEWSKHIHRIVLCSAERWKQMESKKFKISSFTPGFFFNEYYIEVRNVPQNAEDKALRAERLASIFRKFREMSGQDFGDDIEAYGIWFETHADDWWKFSEPADANKSFRL